MATRPTDAPKKKSAEEVEDRTIAPIVGPDDERVFTDSGIEIDRLYEPPFTTVASDGVDGIFTDEAQIGELIRILETFQPQGHQAHA